MEDLLDKALNGNIDSYMSLINYLLSDLYKIAQARLDNKDDIDDAIEETIIKAYKNLHTLKQKEYFKTWLIRILINECNLIYKKNKRYLKLLNKVKNKIDYKDFDDTLISNIDNKIEIQKLLKELNYNERIVIVLHYSNEYSITEIADILDENVNTIKSRLLRAKEKIRNKKKGDIKDDESTK